MRTGIDEPVVMDILEGQIEADLHVPHTCAGLIVFAHGSGSSRFSRRNRDVASYLEDEGFGTLVLDLLTRQEERIDEHTREYRFDVNRLGQRVVMAIDWARERPDLADLPIGCFGASTGAAAALIAAADRPSAVRAIVSRGGRPDLAGDALPAVHSPTLLIVGGEDAAVVDWNKEALRHFTAPAELVVVPGASHLFEEPGALNHVMKLAADWFRRYLVAA